MGKRQAAPPISGKEEIEEGSVAELCSCQLWTVNVRPAMIPSTMNRDELRKNVDKTFRFVPPPRQDSENGSWESDMNLWILRSETVDKKGVEFLNTIRDHDPLIPEPVQIRNFDFPDKYPAPLEIETTSTTWSCMD